MGDKISIYPEKMPDGAILFEIKVKDPSLIGKKASFSIKRKVSVKDSRPVHGSNVLFKFSFNVNSTNKIRVSAANMKNTSGSFPYSGSKISIKTIAEVKVTTALCLKPPPDSVSPIMLPGICPSGPRSNGIRRN
jgi:hypothetical protein